MNELNPSLVNTVSNFLKGKRLEVFQSCVAIINDSLAQGGWTLRGSVKSVKGFSQGLMGSTPYLEYKNLRTFNKENSEMEETSESIFRDKLSDFCRTLGGSPRRNFELYEIEALYNALLEEVDRSGKSFNIKFVFSAS